jgi:hypothetical protein
MEHNLSKLVVNTEKQLKNPRNHVETQTQAEHINGKDYFTNVVRYRNPELVRLSQRIYDPKVSIDETNMKYQFNSKLPPIFSN